MKYNFPISQTCKDFAASSAMPFTILLLAANSLSLFAEWHWFADLFSHFSLQYLIGSVLLSALYAFLHKWKLLALMTIIGLFNLWQLQPHIMPETPISARTQPVSLLVYNRLVTNQNHDVVKKTLGNTSAHIVILQEANQSLAAMASQLKNIYPYQIHEPRSHAFGMIILSKYPFQSAVPVNTPNFTYDNFAIRLVIKLPDSPMPVILYALHAIPPLGDAAWKQRNAELALMADLIAKDNSPYIFFTGDWNVTPYSPFFKKVLKASKLHNSYSGVINLATWPAPHLTPFLQIPIDHMLHSSNIALLRKTRLPSMGSDHYPVLGVFTLLPVTTAP